MTKILGYDFFDRDALEVAPQLTGKILVHRLADGTELRERIFETEAYRGEEDLACHASKGRTPRTQLLYGKPGIIYIYLCYGMHWLMNVITGDEGNPQGVLLRAGDIHNGPAKLTKYLQIDGEFNGCPIYGNNNIWIEDDGFVPVIKTAPRVGIDYAGEYWKNIPWRYIVEKR